jgi:hypothetical protein
MRNRRPGSIADRVFCAKSAAAFSCPAAPPQTRAKKIGFRYGGPGGIALGGPADLPADMRIDRRSVRQHGAADRRHAGHHGLGLYVLAAVTPLLDRMEVLVCTVCR